jgi:hypothetical protein
MSEVVPKIIKLPVIDGATGEVVYLEMEHESFIEWEQLLDQEILEREERLKEVAKLESDLWQYVRGDD